MKVNLFSNLATILLLFLTLGKANTQVIPIQSHSFNDVDYIAQQLIKGVDTFKIDVQVMTKPTCLEFSTWKDGQNECQTNMFDAEHCCLGFRGDCSSGDIVNDYFNTTYELVDKLNSGALDFILSKNSRLPRYNSTKYISINQQYPDKTGPLSKKFLYDLITVIKTKHLDIIILLPETTIIDYFQNICRNMGNCDHEDLVIATFDGFIVQGDQLQESNPAYKNLNIEFPDVVKFCQSGFPEYADPTPYLFYEFSHEQDVDFLVNTFLSNDCHRRESHNTIDSIRLTSNVDQEMIQSHISKMSNKIDYSNISNIFSSIAEPDLSFILCYFDKSKGSTILELRSLQQDNFLKVLDEKTLNTKSSTQIQLFSYKQGLLAIKEENSQLVQIFEVDIKNSKIEDIKEIKEVPAQEEEREEDTPQVIALDIIQIEISKQLLFTISTNANDCMQGLLLNGILVSEDSSSMGEVDYSECISQEGLQKTLNADLSFVLSTTNTLDGLLILSKDVNILADQVKPALFAFPIHIDLNQKSIDITLPKDYYDFGDQPRVNLYQNPKNNELFFFEAHTHGINQNGALLNNGNTYKCGISDTPFYTKALLQSIKYMMNYNWGRFDDIKSRIQDGVKINACDKKIMHGKFGNGQFPSIVLYSDKNNQLKSLIINEHVNFNLLPTNTKLFFGSNIPGKLQNSNSIDISLFDIPDFNIFSHL